MVVKYPGLTHKSLSVLQQLTVKQNGATSVEVAECLQSDYGVDPTDLAGVGKLTSAVSSRLSDMVYSDKLYRTRNFGGGNNCLWVYVAILGRNKEDARATDDSSDPESELGGLPVAGCSNIGITSGRTSAAVTGTPVVLSRPYPDPGSDSETTGGFWQPVSNGVDPISRNSGSMVSSKANTLLQGISGVASGSGAGAGAANWPQASITIPEDTGYDADFSADETDAGAESETGEGDVEHNPSFEDEDPIPFAAYEENAVLQTVETEPDDEGGRSDATDATGPFDHSEDDVIILEEVCAPAMAKDRYRPPMRPLQSGPVAGTTSSTTPPTSHVVDDATGSEAADHVLDAEERGLTTPSNTIKHPPVSTEASLARGDLDGGHTKQSGQTVPENATEDPTVPADLPDASFAGDDLHEGDTEERALTAPTDIEDPTVLPDASLAGADLDGGEMEERGQTAPVNAVEDPTLANDLPESELGGASAGSGELGEQDEASELQAELPVQEDPPNADKAGSGMPVGADAVDPPVEVQPTQLAGSQETMGTTTAHASSSHVWIDQPSAEGAGPGFVDLEIGSERRPQTVPKVTSAKASVKITSAKAFPAASPWTLRMAKGRIEVHPGSVLRPSTTVPQDEGSLLQAELPVQVDPPNADKDSSEMPVGADAVDPPMEVQPTQLAGSQETMGTTTAHASSSHAWIDQPSDKGVGPGFVDLEIGSERRPQTVPKVTSAKVPVKMTSAKAFPAASPWTLRMAKGRIEVHPGSVLRPSTTVPQDEGSGLQAELPVQVDPPNADKDSSEMPVGAGAVEPPVEVQPTQLAGSQETLGTASVHAPVSPAWLDLLPSDNGVGPGSVDLEICSERPPQTVPKSPKVTSAKASVKIAYAKLGSAPAKVGSAPASPWVVRVTAGRIGGYYRSLLMPPTTVPMSNYNMNLRPRIATPTAGFQSAEGLVPNPGRLGAYSGAPLPPPTFVIKPTFGWSSGNLLPQIVEVDVYATDGFQDDVFPNAKPNTQVTDRSAASDVGDQRPAESSDVGVPVAIMTFAVDPYPVDGLGRAVARDVDMPGPSGVTGKGRKRGRTPHRPAGGASTLGVAPYPAYGAGCAAATVTDMPGTSAKGRKRGRPPHRSAEAVALGLPAGWTNMLPSQGRLPTGPKAPHAKRAKGSGNHGYER